MSQEKLRDYYVNIKNILWLFKLKK